MRDSILLMLANDSKFKIIGVQFASGPQLYHYMTIDEFDIGEDKPDQFVIVDTPKNGMVAAKVVEVIDPLLYNGFVPLKWAVQKVYLEQYKNCKRVEAEVRQSLAQAEQKAQREQHAKYLAEQIGEEAVASVKALVRL